MEKIKDIDEALRNTTIEQFSELGKAIQNCAFSLSDVTKASQIYGDALNAVPPYTRPQRKHVSIIRIVKIVLAMAVISVVVFILVNL